MNCHKCGKENHEGSKFCRFCGNKLSEKKHIKIPLSPKVLVIILILIIIGASIVYAAPKVIDYRNVQSAIAQAQTLQASGQYQQALNTLTAMQGKWSTSSTKNNIVLMEQNEQKYIGWQNDYNTALTEVATSSYTDAQTLLQGIDPSYPQYSLVKNELVTVQTDIQTALNAQVQAAVQSAKTAQQNAAAQKAAAAAAERQAETAAENASAETSAATTQDAINAFVNQLTNINDNFNNNCDGAFAKAIQEVEYGEDDSVYIGAAASACAGVESDAKNLNTSYTMSSSYVNAANAMEWAGYYEDQAIQYFVDGDNTDADTELGDASAQENIVSSFLQSQ